MSQAAPPIDIVPALVLLGLLVGVGVPVYAGRARGRTYAAFAAVLLAFTLPGALVTHTRWVAWLPAEWRPWVHAAFAWGLLAAAVHLVHLVRARLRGRVFRALVSVPGQVFVAAGFMASFWQLALLPIRWALGALGWHGAVEVVRWLELAPFAVAGLSVVTSVRRPLEWVRVRLGADGPRDVERVPVERHRRAPAAPIRRPLRLVQITDPHLGPWQSVSRLRRTVEALLRHEPDLVLLTGDFLTMEGQGSRGALGEALAPLRACAGRSFAIFGNHDHESPEEVRDALDCAGVVLLVDEATVAETPAGPVQIVGADYVRRERDAHLAGLLARHPRPPGTLRLLLLHDPSGFVHVPPGEVDLTLSGHTHGGQVGLVSLGLDWTVLRGSRWPDHGLFARGSNRLYVHRGTGFYGFPLRVGVPGELSVLELLLD